MPLYKPFKNEFADNLKIQIILFQLRGYEFQVLVDGFCPWVKVDNFQRIDQQPLYFGFLGSRNFMEIILYIIR